MAAPAPVRGTDYLSAVAVPGPSGDLFILLPGAPTPSPGTYRVGISALVRDPWGRQVIEVHPSGSTLLSVFGSGATAPARYGVPLASIAAVQEYDPLLYQFKVK